MNRRTLSLVLVLAFCLTSLTAFAASQPAQPGAPVTALTERLETSALALTGEAVTEFNVTTGVKLNWTAAEGALKYQVTRSDTSGGSTTVISGENNTSTSFVDVNIQSNRTYYYKVAPMFASGGSADISKPQISNEVGVKVVTASPAAANPKNSGYILMQIGDPKMVVNGFGTEVDPGRNISPKLKNGRTMVPIRAAIESMGGTADWNELTREVTIKSGNTTVVMTDKKIAYTVNGASRTMDVSPFIENGRTYVPLRFANESVGAKVSWIHNTKEILITFDKSMTAIPAVTPKPTPTPKPTSSPSSSNSGSSTPKPTATPAPTPTPAPTQPTPTPDPADEAVKVAFLGFWANGMSDLGCGSYIWFKDDYTFTFGALMPDIGQSIFMDGRFSVSGNNLNLTEVSRRVYLQSNPANPQKTTNESLSVEYSFYANTIYVEILDGDHDSWNYYQLISSEASKEGTLAEIKEPA